MRRFAPIFAERVQWFAVSAQAAAFASCFTFQHALSVGFALARPRKQRLCRETPTPSEKAAPEPTFSYVASLIAGADAPSWLTEYFQDWSPSLMLGADVHKRQPTKAKMKKQLQEAVTASLVLQRALNDAAICEFLETPPFGRIDKKALLGHMLDDLGRRAKYAIASPTLSTPDGKTPPGADRAMLPNAVPPRTFCAALIAEAWAYFHGGDPPPRNLKAARAAHALWLASGNETKASFGNEPLTSWRYYFKEAREPLLTELRTEIRRYLTEAAHQGRALEGLAAPTDWG
jgi:hypothetical protein